MDVSVSLTAIFILKLTRVKLCPNGENRTKRKKMRYRAVPQNRDQRETWSIADVAIQSIGRYSEKSVASTLDDAWRPTPRWLSAPDVDQQAQSFDWPTAARQSWHQPLVETATQTVPIDTAPQLRNPHNSGHDAHTLTLSLFNPSRALHLDASTQAVLPSSSTQNASTQFSRSAFPRRRICSKKRSRTTAPCPTADSSTPTLQEQQEVFLLMCSSRFVDLSGHPPPPGKAI